MRNDKTLTTIVQDIQEIGGKKEFDMQLTKAKVNAAGASVARKQDEKVVPPGEISCPIGCARGYHLKHEPCPGLQDVSKPSLGGLGLLDQPLANFRMTFGRILDWST